MHPDFAMSTNAQQPNLRKSRTFKSYLKLGLTRLGCTRGKAACKAKSRISYSIYSWSLFEAALRLVTEQEGLSLQKFDPLYLVKQLATEGLISRAEYQVLMNVRSLRNAIAHGFKTSQLTQNSVNELIEITEQLLKALHPAEAG